jgi:hypothetical protein
VAKPRLQAICPRCGRSPHWVKVKTRHVERVFTDRKTRIGEGGKS